jgi:Domain of unknown function (DUF397)
MSTPFNSALWRKSTRSSPSGDNCVEVALDGVRVGVRDSKDPAGSVLQFDARSWQEFLDAAKRGEFDLPA